MINISSPPKCSGSNLSAKEKYAERMKKLRDLHMKRNEARKINHQEVVDEDRRYIRFCNVLGKVHILRIMHNFCSKKLHTYYMKLVKFILALIIRAKEPKNMEARKRRAEYILKEEEMKAECIAAGRDWNIEKLR